MPKLVCRKCECEFKPELNGVGVIETVHNSEAKPYKLWQADLWKCPGCGIEVVAGFSGLGIIPIAEHFQESFSEALNVVKQSKLVVYDHERPKNATM